jgi:hypothetical protein
MGRCAALLLVVVLAALLLVTARSPRGEAHTLGSVETISQVSGKCLDMEHLGQQARAYQWSCVGAGWQKWDIVPAEGSYYHYIVNSYTHLCLDVPNGQPGQGVRPWMWPCNFTNAQKWYITGGAGVWQAIRPKLNTSLCLDVYNAGQGDATPVQLWPCNGTAAQRWQTGLAFTRETAPFSGKWGSGDNYTDARPWNHHIEECEPITQGVYEYAVEHPYGRCTDNPDQQNSPNRGGSWSVDFYAPSNTQVKFYGYGVGAAGSSLTARVHAIAPTCGSDSFGQFGGNTVFVDIFQGGVSLGWVSYGHLKDIAVSAGQYISNGQVLGKTHWWTNAPGQCYVVNTENGVHTHIEMWTDYGRFACFKDWGPLGTQLSYTDWLGDIGRMSYHAYRLPCS